MGKIICDVCGTSFSDNSAQCPICGYVNPALAENTIQESGDTTERGEYNFTKGGRFSKANVKKRLKEHPVEDVDEYSTPDDYEMEEKRNDGPLIIIAILLLLAVAAIVVFITMRYFKNAEEPVGDAVTVEQTVTEEQTTDDTPETTEDETVKSCEKLELNGVEDGKIDIPEGGTYDISVTKYPAETEDEITFLSQDPEIATVDASGRITPVKTGSTVIIITCGEQTVELSVSCTVAEAAPVLTLDRENIEFTYEGESFHLYSGSIPVEEIQFVSADIGVATVDEQGVVTAVAEGETVIEATYGDQILSCTIVCKFDEGGDEQSGNVTEDGDEVLTSPPKATGTKGYKFTTRLGTVYRYDNPAMFEVGNYVGYELPLLLKDGNGNTVSATWKVYNTSICKQKEAGGSTFECLAEGIAYVVATTDDGETYVCVVRVTPYPGG